MAEQTFETAFQKLMKSEGGYVDHPNDPGGATNIGVTQRIYDGWRSQNGYAPQSVRNVTEDEARQIFRTMYWDKVGASSMPIGLDYALADFAYNSGPRRALLTLQKSLGIDQTGLWDEITSREVSHPSFSTTDAIGKLNNQRMAFLKGLPTWDAFGKGWTNRVNEVGNSAIWASQNGGWDGFTLGGTRLESGYGGLGTKAAGYGQEEGYGVSPALGPSFSAVFGPEARYPGQIDGEQSTDTLRGKGGDNTGLGLVYNPATGGYEPGSNPTSAQPEAPGSDWQTNPEIISGQQSTNVLQGGTQPVTNFGMGAPPAGVPAGWYQAPGGQWYDPTDPQYAHLAGKALPPQGGGGGVTNLGMGAQNVSGGVEPAGFSDFGMGATTGNPHWDVNTPEGWTRINEPWKPELQPGGIWYVPADELWGAPEGHSSSAWDDGSGGSAFGRSYNANAARNMQGLVTLNAQGAAQPQAAQASYNAGQQGFYNNAPSAFTPDYGMGTQQPIFGNPMGAYAGAVTPSYDPI
jgi:hypothetical protein